MASTPFDLITAASYTDSDIVDDHIYVSPDQNNSPYLPNLRLVVSYTGADPNNATVRFQAVLEGKSQNGTYYPVAYQFDPYFGFFDQQRVLVIDSGSFWPDAGIDNIVWVGGKTVAQISNTQAALPDTYRVCVNVAKDPGATLTNVTLDIFGERYE